MFLTWLIAITVSWILLCVAIWIVIHFSEYGKNMTWTNRLMLLIFPALIIYDKITNNYVDPKKELKCSGSTTKKKKQ